MVAWRLTEVKLATDMKTTDRVQVSRKCIVSRFVCTSFRDQT